MNIKEYALVAKQASIALSTVSGETKNNALKAIARDLARYKNEIFQANFRDLQNAETEGLSAPNLKRLRFDDAKLKETLSGLESLISLDEPVGKQLKVTELDEGLILHQVSCPIGVIGVIFESRPDALVQIATLCLKSGNAALLKGGSEALETNKILAKIIYEASIGEEIPERWMHLLETRQDVQELLSCEDSIDLLIPRGSNEFVKYIMNHTKIPVMGHADGICHCFVDKFANLEMATQIVVDAKTQYVAVCNATETLLVDEKIAKAFLPMIHEAFSEKHVIMYGCELTQKIIAVEPATSDSYITEYLDYEISIKVVKDFHEAIHHINQYGSGHTDAIITHDNNRAEVFMNQVDSANVFLNCSTRFSDGFRYGFGAEVGISTAKIHARGPVGLEGLLIYKYKLYGHGQIVADYSEGRKTFTHRDLSNHA
ncbi:MAG: glutamate-5-semialdehyde dehydrogenase [Clostridia bacterium]